MIMHSTLSVMFASLDKAGSCRQLMKFNKMKEQAAHLTAV